MSRQDDIPESPCIGTAMRKASRRLSQLYDKAIAPAGLRGTQFSILSELERRSKSPPTMSELAEALVMDRSALGHNLRPLEREGLIALESSDADRRRRLVVVTALGRTKYKEARRLWRNAQERFESVYGASATAELRGVLLGIAHEERLTRLED